MKCSSHAKFTALHEYLVAAVDEVEPGRGREICDQAFAGKLVLWGICQLLPDGVGEAAILRAYARFENDQFEKSHRENMARLQKLLANYRSIVVEGPFN